MGSNTRFPFLKLPSELRDEVYKLIVLRDFNPQLYTPVEGKELQTPPPFPPSESDPIDLSILRVNKQIHDEASWIFYTKTVFPVQILAKWSVDEHNDCDVEYKTPWEEIHYRYRDGKYYYIPSTNPDDIDFSTLEEACPRGMFKNFPLPNYRHLIRKIQINFYDQFQIYDHAILGIIPCPQRMRQRPDGTKILLFACERLESSLSCPGRERANIPEAEINVYVTAGKDILYAQYSNPSRVPREFIVNCRKGRHCLFREVIQTAYPLMNCLWKPKVNMCHYIERDFPGLVEETIGDCVKKSKGEGDWRRRLRLV
ncbi:hypothetical protein TWF506_007567 [Arthrobotrys conoides]|uniref:Uncharacterized protein n=1 Tax=Arthrobotrys conoides TaxID=74498 RepID=A0AAN8NPC2_9PEZI